MPLFLQVPLLSIVKHSRLVTPARTALATILMKGWFPTLAPCVVKVKTVATPET
jgi:hypothetical protein